MSTLPQDKSEGKSYQEEFDCKFYLNKYYAPFTGSPSPPNIVTYFHCKQLHDFYTKHSSKWNSKTARLLEFGGGAVITWLISAAPYIDQVTLAAYTEGERKEIELWKHGKEGAHDWSSHIRYIVNEVEHVLGDDAWCEREDLLRRRITNIIPCDIFCDNPLFVKQELFEVVQTNLCLEVTCRTYEEYKVAIKKLVGLLKPGGFLVMCIDECASFYMVGNKKWPSLYLTLEQVKEAVIEAGTEILVAERDPAPLVQLQNPTDTDYKAVLVVAARKREL